MRLIVVFSWICFQLQCSMKDSNVNEQERQSNFIARHEIKVKHCSVAYTCVYWSRWYCYV